MTIREIQLINKLINDDILNNYIIFNGENKIYDLCQYDKNSIYIFFNNNSRIYVIKQKYYHIEGDELKNISKRYINQNEIYESKKLIKIKEPKRKNKKIKK